MADDVIVYSRIDLNIFLESGKISIAKYSFMKLNQVELKLLILIYLGESEQFFHFQQ